MNKCDQTSSLGASARASILWGGGFTLIRDVAQFGVMLILVRLLTPADYGTAALVQAIVGVFSIISFNTFSSHALQQRNPDEIDWQAHFTAAAALNTAIAALVLVFAFGLSFVDRYRGAALPLAALSVVFLIEIPGTLRHRMLEVHHDWKRFRLMVIIGTLLGLGVGLAVGLMGGGVWALIVQIPMLGIPAAIDLFVTARFKPDWTWSWARYREAALFGFNRVGAGGVGRIRQLIEQVTLASVFDLATLGIFSRAMGLSQLLVGRIGGVTMSALYPVVTRAERGSDRFQRLSGLVLRAVAWTTIPIAAVLALAAADIVHLLYGSQWSGVVPLLLLAAATTAMISMANALSTLLLANEESGAAFWLDLAAAGSGVVAAVVFIPQGPASYLIAWGSVCVLLLMGTLVVLVRSGGITPAWGLAALVPAAVAAGVAVMAVLMSHYVSGSHNSLFVRLGTDGFVFGTVYVLVLRTAFADALAELLGVVPLGGQLSRALRLNAVW